MRTTSVPGCSGPTIPLVPGEGEGRCYPSGRVLRLAPRRRGDAPTRKLPEHGWNDVYNLITAFRDVHGPVDRTRH